MLTRIRSTSLGGHYTHPRILVESVEAPRTLWSLHGVGTECTRSPHGVHTECTRSVHGVHREWAWSLQGLSLKFQHGARVESTTHSVESPGALRGVRGVHKDNFIHLLLYIYEKEKKKVSTKPESNSVTGCEAHKLQTLFR